MRRSMISAALSMIAFWAVVSLSEQVVLGSDRYFAGSAQLDYLLVPLDDRGRDTTFDGFTTELSLKLSADVNEHLAFGVKVCFGCHGFEVGLAHADLRIADELTIRVGRFMPAFGDFPGRHDPANHHTSDKPLPYDMGRMLRLKDWNMSVIPAPYIDNGIELRGTFEMGDSVELDYAAYAIGGFRGNANALDVDFIQSRSAAQYYVDNNSRPTVGGRLALGVQLGDIGSLRLGSSAMYGTYDPKNELDLLILGGDLVLKLERWVLRAEYLIRRTQMALGTSPETRFRYGPGADGQFDPYFTKEGWYVETEYPVWGPLELLGRFDGMRRRGNVSVTSPLRSDSLVFRYTLALSYRASSALRIKLSGEFYDFSDFHDEAGIHLGLVGTF